MLMASHEKRAGKAILSSSLSGDRILRRVQIEVARREGRAVIVDDAPASPYKGPKLNLPKKSNG